MFNMIRFKYCQFFVLLLHIIGHCPAQKIISDEKWAVLCQNVPAKVYTRLPGECSRFFICIDGFPSILDCPDNLYFDPEDVVCGYPGDIKCYKDVEDVTTEKDSERTTTVRSTTTTVRDVWTHEMEPPEAEEVTEGPERAPEPERDDDDSGDDPVLDDNSQVECCRFYGTRRVCTEC